MAPPLPPRSSVVTDGNSPDSDHELPHLNNILAYVRQRMSANATLAPTAGDATDRDAHIDSPPPVNDIGRDLRPSADESSGGRLGEALQKTRRELEQANRTIQQRDCKITSLLKDMDKLNASIDRQNYDRIANTNKKLIDEAQKLREEVEKLKKSKVTDVIQLGDEEEEERAKHTETKDKLDKMRKSRNAQMDEHDRTKDKLRKANLIIEEITQDQSKDAEDVVSLTEQCTKLRKDLAEIDPAVLNAVQVDTLLKGIVQPAVVAIRNSIVACAMEVSDLKVVCANANQEHCDSIADAQTEIVERMRRLQATQIEKLRLEERKNLQLSGAHTELAAQFERLKAVLKVALEF